MWESPPAKSSDKSLSSSGRCHHAATTASTPSTAAAAAATATVTRRGDGSSPRIRTTVTGLSDEPPVSPPVIYVAAPGLLASSRRAEAIDNNHGTAAAAAGNGAMLTLDEFLRETSRASSIPAVAGAYPPSAAETERQLHAMLLMSRDRRNPADRDASLPPRSPSTPGSDSFDTLVTQIRRIGALQDAMLSNVDSTTSSLEDYARRERSRSAVDTLRIREARLRAMQTRIDLLASEFQLLRSTRRELRRVRCVPLSGKPMS